MKTYILNVLIGFDRFVNALIRGNPSETLSSVAFRKHRDKERFGFMFYVINTLFGNPHHCEAAYTSDRNQKLAA
jgi:hypothetical protein